MNESQIKALAAALARWNPLGDYAATISDLDGYKTEAIDILSCLSFFSGKKSTADVVSDVLSQAFDLPLDEAAVKGVAEEIEKIMSIRH